jgi:hypothetical protein
MDELPHFLGCGEDTLRAIVWALNELFRQTVAASFHPADKHDINLSRTASLDISIKFHGCSSISHSTPPRTTARITLAYPVGSDTY